MGSRGTRRHCPHACILCGAAPNSGMCTFFASSPARRPHRTMRAACFPAAVPRCDAALCTDTALAAFPPACTRPSLALPLPLSRPLGAQRRRGLAARQTGGRTADNVGAPPRRGAPRRGAPAPPWVWLWGRRAWPCGPLCPPPPQRRARRRWTLTTRATTSGTRSVAHRSRAGSCAPARRTARTRRTSSATATATSRPATPPPPPRSRAL